jgi:hypothetical protein
MDAAWTLLNEYGGARMKESTVVVIPIGHVRLIIMEMPELNVGNSTTCGIFRRTYHIKALAV